MKKLSVKFVFLLEYIIVFLLLYFFEKWYQFYKYKSAKMLIWQIILSCVTKQTKPQWAAPFANLQFACFVIARLQNHNAPDDDNVTQGEVLPHQEVKGLGPKMCLWNSYWSLKCCLQKYRVQISKILPSENQIGPQNWEFPQLLRLVVTEILKIFSSSLVNLVGPCPTFCLQIWCEVQASPPPPPGLLNMEVPPWAMSTSDPSRNSKAWK